MLFEEPIGTYFQEVVNLARRVFGNQVPVVFSHYLYRDLAHRHAFEHVREFALSSSWFWFRCHENRVEEDGGQINVNPSTLLESPLRGAGFLSSKQRLLTKGRPSRLSDGGSSKSGPRPT